MHEVSAHDGVDGEYVSQDPEKLQVPVQAADDDRGIRQAGRGKWIAIAAGAAVVIALLAALFLARVGDAWR